MKTLRIRKSVDFKGITEIGIQYKSRYISIGFMYYKSGGIGGFIQLSYTTGLWIGLTLFFKQSLNICILMEDLMYIDDNQRKKDEW